MNETQTDQTKTWIINQGHYDDMAVRGIYTGTQAQVDHEVAALNESRRYEDPFDGAVTYQGEKYWSQEVDVITSASEYLAQASDSEQQ